MLLLALLSLLLALLSLHTSDCNIAKAPKMQSWV
jgi:hypothetical protein